MEIQEAKDDNYISYSNEKYSTENSKRRILPSSTPEQIRITLDGKLNIKWKKNLVSKNIEDN